MHECSTHEEWLANNHYFCSCGHVEWAHYKNGRCAHCNCTQYNGEKRPLTDFEKLNLLGGPQPSFEQFIKDNTGESSSQ